MKKVYIDSRTHTHTYSHSSPLKLRQTTSQRRTYESFIFRLIGVLALGERSLDLDHIGRGIKVKTVVLRKHTVACRFGRIYNNSNTVVAR